MYSRIAFAVVILLFAYLWHANRAISRPPAEARELAQKRWSDTQIKDAYEKARTSPTDVTPYLHGKKNRRYIVCGGSGSVGGWIVEHLLMRGESPEAIRILDFNEPTRKGTVGSGVAYVKTDVTDKDAVLRAFEEAWPSSVRKLPLTVFHTVAYINPGDRHSFLLGPYLSVNVEGTRNMLAAAESAGSDCFVATSSGSVGLRPASYWPWPWQSHPKDIYQFLPNADPKSHDLPFESYAACYAYSKVQAEKLVMTANTDNFRTGIIRPCHGIYGHGVRNPNSLTWQYLSRGGSPTWLTQVIAHFISAENVSVGHLSFENALLDSNSKVGGNAYAVIDRNPPIVYGDLYRMLSTMAHPSTPINFPELPQIAMLLLAYALEQYQLLRHRLLPFLPALNKDLAFLQPAVFNLSSPHIVYTDDRARSEIGYDPPITTLEGFALALVEWNEIAEAKLKAGTKAAELQEDKILPEPPKIR